MGSRYYKVFFLCSGPIDSHPLFVCTYRQCNFVISKGQCPFQDVPAIRQHLCVPCASKVRVSCRNIQNTNTILGEFSRNATEVARTSHEQICLARHGHVENPFVCRRTATERHRNQLYPSGDSKRKTCIFNVRKKRT